MLLNNFLSGSPSPSPTCSDGNVRLANMNSFFDTNNFTGESLFVVEGTVEVCYNGNYGYVCDLGWDIADSTVACRDLGYFDFGKFLLQHHSAFITYCMEYK